MGRVMSHFIIVIFLDGSQLTMAASKKIKPAARFCTFSEDPAEMFPENSGISRKKMPQILQMNVYPSRKTPMAWVRFLCRTEKATCLIGYFNKGNIIAKTIKAHGIIPEKMVA